jgi:hypothetical protein
VRKRKFWTLAQRIGRAAEERVLQVLNHAYAREHGIRTARKATKQEDRWGADIVVFMNDERVPVLFVQVKSSEKRAQIFKANPTHDDICVIVVRPDVSTEMLLEPTVRKVLRLYEYMVRVHETGMRIPRNSPLRNKERCA